ncbi:MAG: YtxH domain-containing protein [Gammaproteobacteria bacterium]
MNQNDRTPEHTKSGIAVGSLALGAIAGVIAGVLFAPQSGQETRDDIKDILARIKDDVALRLSEIKDVTEDTYRNVVESVVQAYRDTREISVEQANSIKSDLDKGYDEIKKVTKRAGSDAKNSL